MKKKTLILSIGGILLVSLITIGLTYAYWIAAIDGTGEAITLKIANLKVVLTDTEILSSEEVEPGWSDSKTFTVENQGNTTREYNIVIKNLVNTLVTEDSLQYKITSDNGYNMSEYASVPKATGSDQVLAYNISIEGNTTHTYTIEFRYVNDETLDQSEDMGKEFSGNLSITEGTEDPNKTLYNVLLSDNTTRLTRTDFSTIFTDDNTGTLYVAEEPWTEDINGDGTGETVYYFAGNALNNWVKFGKDQNGSDLYWRIIRTNEDGGVRLLYVGPDMATESAFPVLDGVSLSGGSDTTGCYNCAIYNNTMYVGYMYGSTGSLANNRNYTTSSPIKTVTDNWYAATLDTGTDGTYTYDSYVSKTAIYCNDRANSTYGETNMYYAAYDRLFTNKQPSYKCGSEVSGALYESIQAIEDKFSASTTSGGNGQLDYPIAQMTADEVAFAGGVQGQNAQAWYYYNSVSESAAGDNAWWTISSAYIITVSAGVFGVVGSTHPGYLSIYSVYSPDPGVRPVLSLKSCVSWTGGDGSSSTPYEVVVSETCANSEN